MAVVEAIAESKVGQREGSMYYTPFYLAEALIKEMTIVEER